MTLISSKKGLLRKRYLPYAKQLLDQDDFKAVLEVLNSDYLTTGPKIKEFEEAFAAYLGVKYAVALSSGTAALHAACFVAGVSSGDEVITTPMTFAASANCILYQGGIPVFADINPKTYNIDPEEIRKGITSKTKAIIPVHYTGQPCALNEIHKLAKEYKLTLIEDAAHALGASYQGKKIGGLSDLTIFSFHPVKHITTGEGGMVTTNDEDLYERLLSFRTHGITRNNHRYQYPELGSWYYEQQFLGYNYRLTDLQAALGLSQLAKLDQFLARRRKIAQSYERAFKDLEGVIIPYQMENVNSAWHIYVLQLELEKLKVGRREVFKALQAEKIGVNVHYIPVYFHPYYQNLGYKKGLCPKAERLYERIITIPLFPGMSAKDVEDVIMSVKKVLKEVLR